MRLLLVALAVSAVGCASTPERPEPPPRPWTLENCQETCLDYGTECREDATHRGRVRGAFGAMSRNPYAVIGAQNGAAMDVGNCQARADSCWAKCEITQRRLDKLHQATVEAEERLRQSEERANSPDNGSAP